MDVMLIPVFYVALFHMAVHTSHVTAHSHTYDEAGHEHSFDDDHTLFLGKKLKDQFDSLTLDESKRRLR